jgi:hypothetical protein
LIARILASFDLRFQIYDLKICIARNNFDNPELDNPETRSVAETTPEARPETEL